MKRNLSKQSGIKFILFTIAVGMCFLSAGHNAMADDYAYYTAAGGLFGTLDLNTGNTVGSTFYLGYAPTSGIGVANGTLYNLEFIYPFSLLHSIDPVTQSTSNLYYPAILAGIINPPIGSANDVLYTIGHVPQLGSNEIRYYLTNIATADNILIMQIVDPGAIVSGLSSGSNTLYFALADTLYAANTSTDPLIGSMGSGLGIGSMVFENGTLYGAGSSGKIYTINTTTGAATLLSNNGFEISGLAPAPAPGPSSAPEPATMLLLGLGLVGLAGIRRKFKQ